MKLYKVGDTSRAVCSNCKGVRSTTFVEREVSFSSGRGTVKDLLVAVCDGCDQVASIPQQSTPRIKDALEKVRRPLEARIPRQLSDALGLACTVLGVDVHQSMQNVIFRYFVSRVAGRPALIKRLPELSKAEDAKGQASARLSIELSEPLHEVISSITTSTHLNKSEVTRAILVVMKCSLLDKEDKKLRRELQNIVAVAG